MALPADPGAVVDAFLDAWNRHDMDAYEALFAPDSHFVNVFGAWWKGRDENVAHHRHSHKGVHRDSTLHEEDRAVVPLGEAAASVILRWKITGLQTPSGDPVTEERRGTLCFAVARQAGGWIIRAASNTPLVAR